MEEFGVLVEMVNDVKKLIICGDFNLWLDDGNENDVKEFLEVMDIYHLINRVQIPTSVSGHILDLVLHFKDSNLIRNIKVESDFEISKSHKPITFSVDTNKSKNVWK